MRVAFIHSPARSGALTGEDLAAASQALALRAAGIEVIEMGSESGTGGRSQRALNAVSRREHPIESIGSVKPDVIHVHKWFPWMRSSDFRRLPGPFVATLHNFRPLCPVGTLFRDGKFCDDCVNGFPVGLVKHGCFRGSIGKSGLVALTRPQGARKHEFFESSSALVSPSQRAAEIVLKYVPSATPKIRVVPSFVDGNLGASGVRAGWLFVGQLEETKGIRKLVKNWPAGELLTVAGAGSQYEELRASAVGNSKISFLGQLSRSAVQEQMKLHEGLIFPSEYLETQGLVVGEAAAAGTPVVALDGTAGADQVREGAFGVVVDNLWRIGAALQVVRDDFEVLSEAGVRYWRDNLAEEAWVSKIVSVYNSVTHRGVC